MKVFRALATAAVLLCLCVVVYGAHVRLSDAGLGCPDWPGCYGQLTAPEAPDEIRSASERFPERPVEPPKARTEMTHRYLASTLGALIVAMALVAHFARPAGVPRRLPWVLVALVAFQGLLGMWTVTLLLKPLVVTAHLLGGMATLGLLAWLWLELFRAAPPMQGPGAREPRRDRDAYFSMVREEAPAASAPRGLRVLAAVGLIVLAGQIFLGGWTSSNYAALACPELPTCQGRWWPEMDVGEAFTLWRGLGVNYEHGVLDNRARVTIHWLHRVGALAASVVLVVFGGLLWRRGGAWKATGVAVLAALALQVGIGAGLVWLQLPLLLAAGHNAGAALLLLAVIAANHVAWRPPR